MIGIITRRSSASASNQRLDVADREEARVESALLALVAASGGERAGTLVARPGDLSV